MKIAKAPDKILSSTAALAFSISLNETLFLPSISKCLKNNISSDLLSTNPMRLPL